MTSPEVQESSVNHDQILPRVIEEEMKTAYINYAMSVIVGRALPDVKDGLKPVHRRILYAMHEIGLAHNKPFKKCARIVGGVLGSYHPHGDSSVYDALVRMAQDFSLRYPLIKGQGNFGSIDGDRAAAYRYTEAKLQKLAEEVLKDIAKNTVPFKDNFDGSLQEPVILPTVVPNLLINGSTGIAVGMATNIPPHNLNEICDGVISTIDNPEISTEELMQIIPGPDFPTGGEVICGGALHHAYANGKGKVIIKAITEMEGDKIIVNEIPYMVNKEDLITQIAELVKDKRVEGIRNINDESDREGIRIVIDLKRNTDHQVVLNQLFKYSRLKVSFGINLLALVDNQPKVLALKEILQHHVDHRKVVITRRTQYDLDQAEKRVHLLEGLVIALNNIDAVVAGIKKSPTVEAAKEFLITSFQLSETQAKAILEMRLQKLSSMEQQKIKDEHQQLLEKIAYYKSILESEQKVLDLIKTELEEVKENYGDGRRSKITIGDDDDIDMEELIEEETVVVTMTNSGYVKRLPLDTYKTQKRGGKGVRAAGMKEEDFVEKLYVTSTHDYLLYFTDKGQVYWLKVWRIPEGSRQSKGKHLNNLLELKADEQINAVIPVRNFEEGYLFMGTMKGTVKKTSLMDFSRPRKGGIRAISLDEGDELIRVRYTQGNSEIILATKLGSANRFKESDVRPMGRTARGVRGMRLRENDEVIGMLAAQPGMKLLTITKKGYGKRTPVEDYRLCNRGGKGVTNIKITEKNGPVKAVMLVEGNEELMLVSKQGIGIRIRVSGISVIGRATQGVRVMRMNEGDSVAAAAKIIIEDDDDSELNEEESLSNINDDDTDKIPLPQPINSTDKIDLEIETARDVTVISTEEDLSGYEMEHDEAWEHAINWNKQFNDVVNRFK